MVQRYQFESKSQHRVGMQSVNTGCLQWFKDTSLKANHNRHALHYLPEYRCLQWFKDTSLKANHNSQCIIGHAFQLSPMVQRYQFESKSQPLSQSCLSYPSCLQWFKDTSLKANHNNPGVMMSGNLVVSNGSKILV